MDHTLFLKLSINLVVYKSKPNYSLKSLNCFLLCVLLLFTVLSTQAQSEIPDLSEQHSKFEPANGECLVFIGQDLEAIGGLENYKDGYSNYFDAPTGITVYTNLSPGDESYGHYNNGLDGLKTQENWGAGYSHAQLYLESATYTNSIIAIGVSMVNHEKKISKGKHDHLIRELAQWIIDTKRPVFLRIGYEFDGWDWNHYNKKHYLKAWGRIYTIFKEMKVDNVAFVWQSKGSGSDQYILEQWYPGDDIVDWCGYSYFGNPDTEMITFAKKHNKPVFIAEASPTLEKEGLFFDTDLKKDKIAQAAWNKWFVPFFKTINDNQDVIKAFNYINSNWSEQPMWLNNATFQKVDSRIQKSEFITKKWKEELSKSRYLRPTRELWRTLINVSD